MENINWGTVVQSFLALALVAIPGWLAYLAKAREIRSAEKKTDVEATGVLTDDLLATLKYKEEQIKDLRAQAENVRERHEWALEPLKNQCQLLVDENEALTETLQKALGRIDQLEWMEKGYRKLVKYAQGLEQAILSAGIDWQTVSTTRMIALHDWEGGPHVDLVGDLGDLPGDFGDSRVISQIRREIDIGLKRREENGLQDGNS